MIGKHVDVIADLYGYSKTFCKEISAEVSDAVVRFRYNKIVFIFPPWLEIYENDVERQQDFQEALKTYHALKEAYPACGYELIEVPKCAIDTRTDFILQTIVKSILDDLKNDINQLLGFHDDTPRINYGPCSVFAQLFLLAWNDHFKEKVHICFVMTLNRDDIHRRADEISLLDFAELGFTDEWYLDEKRKAGANSYQCYEQLRAKVRALCQEELSQGSYRSALKLSQVVASRVVHESLELLSTFTPYKNRDVDGLDWTKPTFYYWCNEEYKAFKGKSIAVEV